VSVYPFIEAEKSRQCNVKRACELLKVSRSAYYQARDGRPSKRAAQDAELAAQVKTVHEESKGRYGSPRVHAALQAQGRRHSRKRAARLMRAGGLQGQGGEAVEEDHDPGPRRRGAGGPDPAGLHRRRIEDRHPLVRRHHLYPHLGRVALPITVIGIASRRTICAPN
jgi:transposase InsO family protein